MNLETANSMNALDQRLLRLSSSALAENLLHTFEDRQKAPDTTVVDDWMQEIRLEVRRRRGPMQDQDERDDGSPRSSWAKEDELMQAIRADGFRLWREQKSSELPTLLKDSKKAKTNQISLFLNQLNASGGALASFMTWERIQEDSGGDSQRQLEMLLGMKHLQDIMPDWSTHVRPFLRKGLCSDDIEQVSQYLKVHREWFDTSRSSTEFRLLQIDLCENVLETMTTLDQGGKASLVVHMFTDWMLRGLYVHDTRVWQIGCSMWKMVLAGLPSNSEDTNSVNDNSIIQADPEAVWFSAWSAHLSPDQCVELTSMMNHKSASALMRAIAPECQSTATRQFWLYILRSILVTTRVARFPWDLFQEEKESPQVMVLKAYLQACALVCGENKTPSPSAKSQLIVYTDAVDTLLCGGRTGASPAVFQEMLTQTRIMSSDCGGIFDKSIARMERT